MSQDTDMMIVVNDGTEPVQDLFNFRATPKGLSLMEELREQTRQREPTFPWENLFQDIHNDKDLRTVFSEKELQGLMLMFNYLYPVSDDVQEREMKEKNERYGRIYMLLDDFRTYIRIRMHPVQTEFLSTRPFEKAECAYDLRKSLGTERLRGALRLFNFFHPHEVQHGSTEPISFTGSADNSGTPPPRMRLHQSPTRFRFSSPGGGGGLSPPRVRLHHAQGSGSRFRFPSSVSTSSWQQQDERGLDSHNRQQPTRPSSSPLGVGLA